MLLEKDKSCLLLIDIQTKLTPFVSGHDALIERSLWLLNLAKRLNVPILASEQYPKGLGHTIEPLQIFPEIKKAYEKTHFSSFAEPEFVNRFMELGKRQVVITGIETHVCVMQTALQMREEGIEVFVVVDAVSSRSELDHKYGLKRMKQNGINLVSSEMVFFEWIRKAGTPEFKALSLEFLPRSK